MPDIDDGAGDRLAVHVADLAVHEQHFALLAAVVEPRLALEERRARDIERTFDGARRAALDAGLALRLVHAEVEEGFKAEARHQQADFVRLSELGEVTHGGPEFVRLDIEVFDRAEQVGDDAMHDALHPRVTLVVAEAG